MKYTHAQLEQLSKPKGIKNLLAKDPIDIDKVLRKLEYGKELKKLHEKLIQVQNWIADHDKRVLLIFEGGEFAGKGGMIRAFTEHLNPRSSRVVALPKPSEKEAGQWYFQRYVMQLPQPGEIVFFDRSWYNRAIIEPINGFCTKKQHHQFMSEVNHFESMLYNDGIVIFKIYISISKQVQAKRIQMIKDSPLRRWELSPVDLNAQKNWKKLKAYEKKMFHQTSTKKVPWKVIDGNDSYKARIGAIKHVLSKIKL
jgi:polyphosphate kinase 2